MKRISIAVSAAVMVALLSSCSEEPRAASRPQEVVESGAGEVLERTVEFEPAVVLGQRTPQVASRGRSVPRD